jgi:hypothetical protein
VGALGVACVADTSWGASKSAVVGDELRGCRACDMMNSRVVFSPGSRRGRQKFYAVRRGHSPGIYNSWADCSRQVNGYSGHEFKSFTTLQEAEEFMRASYRFEF